MSSSKHTTAPRHLHVCACVHARTPAYTHTRTHACTHTQACTHTLGTGCLGDSHRSGPASTATGAVACRATVHAYNVRAIDACACVRLREHGTSPSACVHLTVVRPIDILQMPAPISQEHGLAAVGDSGHRRDQRQQRVVPDRCGRVRMRAGGSECVHACVCAYSRCPRLSSTVAGQSIPSFTRALQWSCPAQSRRQVGYAMCACMCACILVCAHVRGIGH